MKKYLSVIILFISLHTYGQKNVQEILDEYKDSLSNYGIVALVDNGKEIRTGTIGVAYENMPIHINNRFCIGSATKLYTATIILKLQELGLLSIEDSIGSYIPKHPFIDGSIKIQQLMNHTSGITDVLGADLLTKTIRKPYSDYSDSYLLSRIDTVDFEKGKKHEYSNTNYFLLKIITERVTDKPFQTVLTEFIIEPLQLSNTLPYFSNNIDLLAHPIIGSNDFNKFPKIGVNKISYGVGNIVSDAGDLNKFIRALFIDKIILDSNSLASMMTFQSFNKTRIGLGVFEKDYGGKNVIGHSGRTLSYGCFAFLDESIGESYILLTNNMNDPFILALIEKICK